MPPAAALFLNGALATGSGFSLLAGATCALLSIAAWRHYARVEDGVVYVRGVVRWHEPLDLASLTEIDVYWVFGGPPTRTLLLRSAATTRSFDLAWWAHTADLVDEVRARLRVAERGGGPTPARASRLARRRFGSE